MDHRSPLRDLTSLNIHAFEISEMDKSPNESNKKKPRFSVIKAFDPLYDSPHRIFVDISDSPNNSNIFEHGNGNSPNDENINPMLTTLINISDTPNEFLIDDMEKFIEEVIDEAIDNIFTRDNDQYNTIKQESVTVKEDSVAFTECCNNETQLIEDSKQFISTPELMGIKYKCDQRNKIEELEILLRHKDNELTSIKEKLFEIKPVCAALKLRVKECEEEMSLREKQIGNYIEEVEQLKIILNSKDEDSVKLEDEISQIKHLYEEAKLKVIKYEEVKNKADEQVAKYKDDMSKKDEEIEALNEKIFVYEDEHVNLENKIKQYEDILGSQADLLNKQTTEVERLNEENQWAKKHLSNQEIAFGDVYDKYERSKRIIEGYKTNEDILKHNIQEMQDTLNKYEVWRETMKEAADVKYETWKIEIEKVRDEYKTETNKLIKKVKHLEIKNSSLVSTLEQKTNECNKLTELCQEITDKC